jgi:sec-independent protein translocase protein TatA
MMPQLGAPELIIILVIIVLIFGVGKLPEVGQALGKGIREFRGAAEGHEDEEPTAPAPRAAAPPAVEAPRPAAAVEASRQPAASTAPAVTPVAAPVVAEAPRPAAAATNVYTVVDGDTLDSIAQRHQISVDDLMAANGYKQRDRVLYAGDEIKLPSKTA